MKLTFLRPKKVIKHQVVRLLKKEQIINLIILMKDRKNKFLVNMMP